MKRSEVANQEPIFVGDIYQHFKGHFYEVLDIGVDTETGNTVVIYHEVVDPKLAVAYNVAVNATIWVRPINMWFDTVKTGEIRFKLIIPSKDRGEE